MDLNDKAISRFTRIPPALLEAIHDGDPGALEGLARAQLVHLMEHTLNRATEPDAPAQLVTGTMELLRKIGAPHKSDSPGGGQPQVVINISRAKDRSEQVVIEGEAQTLDAQD